MDKKKRNGDLYTFLYAAIMVTITAALLAFVSQILKPRQEANKQVEMQQSILRAVHLADRSYEQYIKDTVVGVQRLPLYICTLDDGSRKFIIPLSGKGLWALCGGIWHSTTTDKPFTESILTTKPRRPGWVQKCLGQSSVLLSAENRFTGTALLCPSACCNRAKAVPERSTK